MTTNRPAIRPPNTIITHHRSPRTAQGAYARRNGHRHRQRPQTAARCALSIAERRNRLSWPGFPPGGSRSTHTHMPSRHSAHSSSPCSPCPARRMGRGEVNPAVGAGFDGSPPSLPAPKVPRWAGESTAPLYRRRPRTKAIRPGERAAPPRPPLSPSLYRGPFTSEDPSRPATRRDRTARWRTISGGGGTSFAEGLCPQSPNPRFGYVSVGSLFTRARPHIFDFSS